MSSEKGTVLSECIIKDPRTKCHYNQSMETKTSQQIPRYKFLYYVLYMKTMLLMRYLPLGLDN